MSARILRLIVVDDLRFWRLAWDSLFAKLCLGQVVFRRTTVVAPASDPAGNNGIDFFSHIVFFSHGAPLRIHGGDTRETPQYAFGSLSSHVRNRCTCAQFCRGRESLSVGLAESAHLRLPIASTDRWRTRRSPARSPNSRQGASPRASACSVRRACACRPHQEAR